MSVRIIDSAEVHLRAHPFEGWGEWLDESGNHHHARHSGDLDEIEESAEWHSGFNLFDGSAGLGGPRFQNGFGGHRMTQIPHHPGFDIGVDEGFTIMTVNAMTNTPTGVNNIFIKREFAGTDPGIEFRFSTSPAFVTPRIQIWDDASNNALASSTADLMTEDKIHVLAARFDRSDDRLSTYVDGVEANFVIAGNITGSLANEDRIQMWPGGSVAYSTDWYAFAFWRRALTIEEMALAEQELRGQLWSVGWQHPEGYLDNLRATQSASDPVPDPGYGVLTEKYEYPVAAALLSYAPAYMASDPILRDLANVFGEELALFRATMDRVLDNHFLGQMRRALGGLLFLKDYGSAHFDSTVGQVSYTAKYEHGDMLSRIQSRSTMLELVRNFQDMTSYPVSLAMNFASPTTVDVTIYDRWVVGQFSIEEAKGLFELALPVHVGIGTYTHASPVITQRHWRGRNDDGSETTATWKADENLTWTQALEENFRIRWQIYNERGGGESPLLNSLWQVQYRLNRKRADGSFDVPVGEVDPSYSGGGGLDYGWRNVNDDADAFVKPTASSEFVSLADTTRQLTEIIGGTYITDNDGMIDDTDNSLFGTSDKLDFDETIDNDYVELEACMELDPSSGNLWASGDYIDFRLARRLTVVGGNGKQIPYYFRMRGLFVSHAGLFIA